MNAFRPGPCQLVLIPLLLGMAGCAGRPSADTDAAVAVVIKQSPDIAEVSAAAEDFARRVPASEVLIVLDLDNTLLAMNSELGADQWYDWQKNLGTRSPCDSRLVADLLGVQGALFFAGAMRLTDARVPGLIDDLTAAGHPVMVLTARGHDYYLSTFRELRRHGLDFRPAGPGPDGGFSEVLKLPGAKRGVWYQDGVMMAAGQHKGDMLESLYRYLELDLPRAVVFADDKGKNIRAMEESLLRLGIPGFLLRYSKEDERVAAFDRDRAAEDWRKLRQPLAIVQQIMQGGHYEVPGARGSNQCEASDSGR